MGCTSPWSGRHGSRMRAAAASPQTQPAAASHSPQTSAAPRGGGARGLPLGGGGRRCQRRTVPSAPPDKRNVSRARLALAPAARGRAHTVRHLTPPYCCEPSIMVMRGPGLCARSVRRSAYRAPATVGNGGSHSPSEPSGNPVTMHESPGARPACCAGTKAAQRTFWTRSGPNVAAVPRQRPSSSNTHVLRCLMPYVRNSQPRPIEGRSGLKTAPYTCKGRRSARVCAVFGRLGWPPADECKQTADAELASGGCCPPAASLCTWVCARARAPGKQNGR